MTTGKYNIEETVNGKVIVMEMTCEERIAYEVALLNTKTELEICREYKVNSRFEAIEGIIEYWQYMA